MATMPPTTVETLPPAQRNGRHEPRPDAPDDGRAVSKAEYWATYYNHPDASYEWNDGYLEAKPLSTPQQYNLYLWFLILLKQYIQVFQTGQLMGLETGFTLVVPDLKFRLRDLYLMPTLEMMAHDPVYQGYVLLDYQQAVVRADTEAAARRAAEAELAAIKAELARLRAQLP